MTRILSVKTKEHSTLCMYVPYFLYSSIHILAIMNNAAENMRYLFDILNSFPLDIYPGVGLQDDVTAVFVILK